MSSLKEKEILIIDDAADVRKLARKILETDGATVREASTIQEGIALVNSSRPHLILLDLHFPDESGFVFLKERRTSNWNDIPTVVLSGLNDRESVSSAVTLGASDYLLKPFRATLLLQKMRKHLRLTIFKAHRFADNERPAITLTVPAVIQRISEVSMHVDSAAKLKPDEVIKIESEILKSNGLSNVVTKTASRPAQYSNQARYLNEVLFAGVGEDFTKKIRKMLKKAEE